MYIRRNFIFLFLLLFIYQSGFIQHGSCAEEKRLEGKKVLMIIAKKDFRDEEFFEPKEVFERNGARVQVASSSLETSSGMLGAKVRPEILIEKVKVTDYDAIVFVGGVGATEYLNNPMAHSIAKEAIRHNRVLAAICIAPAILANANILKDKKATVWKTEAKSLQSRGAKYTGADVEVDGKIITANGPAAAGRFAEKIVELLTVR
jgi:protease I